MNPYKNRDLRAFLESIPEEEVKKQHHLQAETNEKMFQEFKEALAKNICFLCNGKIDEFEESITCLHWFTYPKQIRKKHFEHYLEKPLSFYRLDSYLRWLANTENPIVNINDLKDETSKTSFIETTIKYKNIEWSFSIGYTDKEGHKGSKIGDAPHYHIQMIVDDKPFIRFNDFHIQFTDEDLFFFELLEQAPDLFAVKPSFGMGISVIEDEEMLEYIAKHTTVADDEKTAPFSRQTLIEAPKGKTISGDLIAEAIEESKKTKEPVGRIMQRLISGASFTTVISLGDGVPEMKKRSGKK